MEQSQAIKYLQNKIDDITKLKTRYEFSSEHTKWGISTAQLLEDIFGKSSRIYRNFMALKWDPREPIITRGFEDIQLQMRRQKYQGYLTGLETAKGVLQAGIELIQIKGIEKVFEEKNTPKESSNILKIITLLENKLRKLIREVPDSEDEVNDAIENLFIGAELDGEYSREKISFQYSSKSYTPDFVFEKINTVVEGKYVKHKDSLRRIIKEINDYIVAFKTRYNNLIFVVYDNGIIRDEDEFKNDFQSIEHVLVLIIKH